jgi:hypothetical protein
MGAVVLFSLFPVLSLLSSNAGQVPALSAVRSAVAAVAISLLALGGARIALRGWPRAALVVVGAQLLFFSYGHVYDLVRQVEVSGILLGRHRYLLVVWGAAGLSWIWLVLRVGSRAPITWILALGALLAALPTASLIVSGARAALAARSFAVTDGAAPSAAPEGNLPDIYYIILDGYGRSDVLEDLYGIDNRSFLAALEQYGFYIAGESRSNYSQTLQSLASSLNMTYLDDLAAAMGPGSTDRAPLQELVQHSEVRRTLENLGYETVAFETGYPPTELRDADFFFTPPYAELDLTPTGTGALPINEFEGLLARTTAVRPLLDDLARRQDLAVQLLSFPYQKHRMRVLYTLQATVEATRLDGPQFVFAHIISPHPPFVFNLPGEEFVPIGTFTLQDGGCCTQAEYLKGYSSQVPSVDALVLEMVEAILAGSDPEPVIILQGDHGPGAYLDPDQPLHSDMRERLGILNAYYLPGGSESLLYPSITPVNTFGVVLESTFGLAGERLPDESYFAPGTRPYALTRVTEQAIGR